MSADLTAGLHAFCALAREDWDGFQRAAWAAVGAYVTAGRTHVGVPSGYYRSADDLNAAVPDRNLAGLRCGCTPGCRGFITGNRWTPEGLFWAAIAHPMTILHRAGFRLDADWRPALLPSPDAPERCELLDEANGAAVLARTWLHISPHLPLAAAAALDAVPAYAARLAEVRAAVSREAGWRRVADAEGQRNSV